MAGYVDGYLLPVKKKNLAAYRRSAAEAGRLWRKCGALEYVESAGDDLAPKGMTPFTRYIKPKAGETVVFSYIVFKSRAHRDRVNARVMKALSDYKQPCDVLFDLKRMAYGGFKKIVDL